ncbi:helix-turn-helix domain-containing protein [Streptomyces sp. L2]|uniref:helix-turn-helix domain-containing protein n=1 Tax=Streptomyces sp. L2 TaxID=2162665 RepID=UPI0010132DD6|nr:helix-turn-helix domain-containing protein [Streptomyces sp. L2]
MLFKEPEDSVIVESGMDLSSEQMAELRELAGARDVPADVALRARIVLWSGEGRRRKDIAELAGVAPLTVDRCKARYAERGLAGLEEKRRGGPRTQVPPQVRARVIALTRMSPPADSGLSHWSTRTLADHLRRIRARSLHIWQLTRSSRTLLGTTKPKGSWSKAILPESVRAT